MERPLKSYLRTYRRRGGLTQRELAFLIGAESRTTVSRFEELKRLPNLAAIFACRVVFDTTVRELFPGFFSEIRAGVLERANDLYEDLQGDTSVATRDKLDLLERILRGADRKSNTNT